MVVKLHVYSFVYCKQRSFAALQDDWAAARVKYVTYIAVNNEYRVIQADSQSLLLLPLAS